jgi:hypothetical protein
MSASFPFTLAELQEHFGTALDPAAFVVQNAAALWLERVAAGKRLAILAHPADPLLGSR